MPLEDKKQPIVIKKVKGGGHGHHGGSWKVAFADFAVAMMAFFLVMWIVGATTTDQKAAISKYFKNVSLTEGLSQAPTPGPMGPGGASTSMIDLGGSMDLTRGEGVKLLEKDKEENLDRVRKEEAEGKTDAEAEAEAEAQAAKEADRKRLESLLAELREAVGKSQALKPFKDQLLLDITPEGLRIQIVDKENRPMFDLGSSELKPYTVDILHEIATFVNQVPNRISIAGHTDVTPYVSRRDYSNWELSADRANAARRSLIAGGMAVEKMGRIVGLGSSVLFDKTNPRNPINRRISIVVMNQEVDKALQESAHPVALDELSADAQPEDAAQSAPIEVPHSEAQPAAASELSAVPRPAAEPQPVAEKQAARPAAASPETENDPTVTRGKVQLPNFAPNLLPGAESLAR